MNHLGPGGYSSPYQPLGSPWRPFLAVSEKDAALRRIPSRGELVSNRALRTPCGPLVASLAPVRAGWVHARRGQAALASPLGSGGSRRCLWPFGKGAHCRTEAPVVASSSLIQSKASLPHTYVLPPVLSCAPASCSPDTTAYLFAHDFCYILRAFAHPSMPSVQQLGPPCSSLALRARTAIVQQLCFSIWLIAVVFVEHSKPDVAFVHHSEGQKHKFNLSNLRTNDQCASRNEGWPTQAVPVHPVQRPN